MPTITRAQADEAMKFVWKIQEQIYEETKNMTPEEREAYYDQKSADGLRQMKEINPDGYDLSFLHRKKAE